MLIGRRRLRAGMDPEHLQNQRAKARGSNWVYVQPTVSYITREEAEELIRQRLGATVTNTASAGTVLSGIGAEVASWLAPLSATLIAAIEARAWPVLKAKSLLPADAASKLGAPGELWEALFVKTILGPVVEIVVERIAGLVSLKVGGRAEVASLAELQTIRKLEATGTLTFTESATAGALLAVEATAGGFTLEKVLPEGFASISAGLKFTLYNRGVNAFTVEHNNAASGGFFLAKEVSLELKPKQLLMFEAVQNKWRNSVPA